MKKAIIILILLMPSTCFGFDIVLFGVNITTIDNWKHAVAGVIASQIVHEAGHYVVAESYGLDPSYRFDHVSFRQGTDSEMLWVSRSGFLAQTIIGAGLTILPQTRKSDFTKAFTGASAFHHSFYALTDGRHNKYSDTKNIDRYGGNGTIEASISAGINAALCYYNLK